MTEYVTGNERTQEYIDRLTGLLQFFETLPQEKRNPAQEAVVALMLDHNKKVLDHSVNHKPLMCTWYGNCQEILSAMDIAYYNPVFDLMFHLGLTDYADAKRMRQVQSRRQDLLARSLCRVFHAEPSASETQLFRRHDRAV